MAVKQDCIQALRALHRGVAPSAPSRPKLVIADPPYNMGVPYEAYADNKSYDEYMTWTEDWLYHAAQALHPHGSLWVFVPDEWVSEVDIAARTKLKLFKKQHVVWAYTFGVKCTKKFSRSHCHLLWFTKTKSVFTFNADAVKVASARAAVYKDRRAVAGGKPPDDTWMLLKDQLEPYMGSDKDTWLESRVCGTFKDRKKHSPNQIPVPLMERIVLACSDPGDLVVDPFAGTGSSGVACAKHGRNWQGYDLSATCVAESNRRIKAALAA